MSLVQQLEFDLPRLRNHSSILGHHEAMLNRLNNEYGNNFVQPAHQHALDLSAKAIQLDKWD